MLVEFPRLVAADAVTNALTRVREAGLTPVLAHPERYSCCSVEAVAFWRDARRARCRWTRPRCSRRRPAASGRASSWRPAWPTSWPGTTTATTGPLPAAPISSARQDGAEQAELLTVQNPGAILRDEPLVDVPPLDIRRTWMQRIRQLLGGET